MFSNGPTCSNVWLTVHLTWQPNKHHHVRTYFTPLLCTFLTLHPQKKKKKITLTYFWRETRASRLGTNHWLHKYPQHLPGQIYTSKYSEHHPTPCRQHRDVWIQVPGGSRRWDGWNKCSQNKDKSRLRACCESAREPGAGMRFIFPARQRRQT